DEDVLLEQRRTDQRDVGQQRDPQRGEAHRALKSPGLSLITEPKKNEVSPIASTLSTTPTMICWTWYPTANMASSGPMCNSTIGSASRPIQTLPVIESTRVAPKAPNSSWPSIAMLMTPERSESTPDRAPKASGTASTIVPCSSVVRSSVRWEMTHDMNAGNHAA